MSQKKLIKLISGLSKVEVRHFNWFATRQQGHHKYKVLFDLIRGGEHNDEKLASCIEVPPAALKVYKSQLKKSILESLLLFRLRSDEVISLIEMSTLEQQKGLIQDSKRRLESARKIAQEKESFEYWMLLNDKIKKSASGDDQYLQEWEANRKIIEYLTLRNIRLQLRKGIEELQTPGLKISLINSIIDANPILSQPKSIETVRGKAEYYKIKRVIHIYRGELALAKEFAIRYVETWETHPKMFQQEEIEYIQELRVLLTLYLNQKNYPNAFIQLDKLKSFKAVSPKIKALKSYYCFIPELNLSIDNGVLSISQGFIDRICVNIEHYRLFLDTRQFQRLLFRSAFYLVLSNQFAKAEKLLQIIIHTTSRRTDEKFWEYSRFLLLVIYFENGDIRSFESTLDQVQNFYKNHPSNLRFFKVATKIFVELYTHSENAEKVFISFRNQFKSLLSDNAEKLIIDNCDLLSWTESKVKKTSWAAFQRNKAAQNRRIIEEAFVAFKA